MATVSIIVPVKNEELVVERLLAHLAGLKPHEIIVVDGGSDDATVQLAQKNARVVACRSGRGPQLNAGAVEATGEVLLFLHADVRLGPNSLAAVTSAVEDPEVCGGNLDIFYDGGWESAIFTRINRVRRRLGVFYGDSGIFCRREVFESLGGYRPWPVMEDYEFARRLRRRGKLALLDAPIHVSARRWREEGLWHTMWTWFWIQALFLAGVSPYRLARWYRDVREQSRS